MHLSQFIPVQVVPHAIRATRPALTAEQLATLRERREASLRAFNRQPRTTRWTP